MHDLISKCEVVPMGLVWISTEAQLYGEMPNWLRAETRKRYVVSPSRPLIRAHSSMQYVAVDHRFSPVKVTKL